MSPSGTRSGGNEILVGKGEGPVYQLGNRIQHALRAYTPRDQKAVRTAAETFVANPKLDVVTVISQLGVGEALVSTLQENGVPMPVERTLICPPRSRMGAITAEERAAVRARTPNRRQVRRSREPRVGVRDPESAAGMVETMAKQAARTVGSQIGRQILRGVLGGILGGSRRG